MARVQVFEMPRGKEGHLLGRYRLTMPDNRTENYPGASFVDGTTTHPVDGRTAYRLSQAWSQLVIETYDQETLDLIVALLRDRGETARAAELSGSAVPGEPPADEEEEDEDDLDIMSRIELLEFAKSLGLTPAWNTGSKRLRELIRDHRDRDTSQRRTDSSGD